MRNSVRKMICVGALAALGALSMGTAAFAQQLPAAPASPGPCSYTLSVNPKSTDAFPVQVQITGTGPAGYPVMLFLAGSLVETVANPTGSFTFNNVTLNGDNFNKIAINYAYGPQNAYSTVCAQVGGIVDPRVTPAGVQVGGITASRLAFTGSSDTGRNVALAAGAIAIGTLLVMGARRRTKVDA